MMNTYEQEQRDLRAKQETLKTSISQAEEIYSNVQNFVNLIKRHTDIKELNTTSLNELIDKIVVHEKVVGDDGSKSQRVDIHYKFIGYVPIAQWISCASSINGYTIAELTQESA